MTSRDEEQRKKIKDFIRKKIDEANRVFIILNLLKLTNLINKYFTLLLSKNYRSAKKQKKEIIALCDEIACLKYSLPQSEIAEFDTLLEQEVEALEQFERDFLKRGMLQPKRKSIFKNK